jgi:hypothetical protein
LFADSRAGLGGEPNIGVVGIPRPVQVIELLDAGRDLDARHGLPARPAHGQEIGLGIAVAGGVGDLVVAVEDDGGALGAHRHVLAVAQRVVEMGGGVAGVAGRDQAVADLYRSQALEI